VQIAGIDTRWFLVFFEGPQQRSTLQDGASSTFRTWMLQVLQHRIDRNAARSRDDREEEIARLAAELSATRERLRAALEEHESAREELKSSEEELLSSNEEFRSTNEELETAKEELQSINEELSTTNDELRYRVRQLKELHADVARARDFAEAIIETISQPILVLNGDLRVKRVNSAFCRIFSTTTESTVARACTHLATANGIFRHCVNCWRRSCRSGPSSTTTKSATHFHTSACAPCG
jgi:two-component system CheB/CheR fusion protein